LTVSQRADRWNTIGSVKSASSKRTIPIGPDLVLVLREWKLRCPKEGELGLVFPTRVGTPIGDRNLAAKLESIFKAAHVVKKNGEPKYAPHALRHFFASWCINPKNRGGRELPAKVVQTWLGHSSVTMTLDIYGHLFPKGDDVVEIATAEKALLG